MTHYDTVGFIHQFETKLIYDRPSGTSLLFDLVDDPDEMINLADSDPERLQDMLKRLQDYADTHLEFTGEIARSQETSQ